MHKCVLHNESREQGFLFFELATVLRQPTEEWTFIQTN